MKTRLAAASILIASMALALVHPTRSHGASAQPTEQPSVLTLPAGHLYPNGIAIAKDGTIFVGLITSGQVLRWRPAYGWDVFFPGSEEIYAGTSLRLDEARELLWGASPDFLAGDRVRPHRVFALDAQSGEVRRVLDVPDNGFGNDIAISPDGTIYVTDSRKARVLMLCPGCRAFETVLEDTRLAPPDGVGAAGIARAADGTMVIGNYGTGRLFVTQRVDGSTLRLRELELPRQLENPDGLAFAPDGALLVLEGSVRSGDGKLVRVPNPLYPGKKTLEVLRAGLISPTNMTVTSNGDVLVSESRIRHRLRPETASDVPTEFQILRLRSGR